MSGGKVDKNFIDLSYSGGNSVNAENIPFDGDTTIKEQMTQISSGFSNRREVEIFTVTADNLTDKCITLTYAPTDSEIELSIFEGPILQQDVDFNLVDDDHISWAAEDCTIGMESSDLSVNDIIQVVYTRSLLDNDWVPPVGVDLDEEIANHPDVLAAPSAVGFTDMVRLTQAEYDLISPDTTSTIYFIIG